MCVIIAYTRIQQTTTNFVFSYFFQIMSEYDQTFDRNILIGHCDLISWFNDFALYLGTQLVYEQTSLFAYDKTFDPNVVLGHCDLISQFSDFALYLGTQLVYEHTVFTICLRMTRPLTLNNF